MAQATHNVSRRLVVASLAIIPAAIAAPALALTGAGPDPIFAAIKDNRRQDAELIRLCDSEDELEERGVELIPAAPDDRRTAEMVAVVDAGIKSRKSLARTAPTTLAGLMAYIDYVRDWSPDEFLFDGSSESRDFLESLHRAVHGLSKGAVS